MINRLECLRAMLVTEGKGTIAADKTRRTLTMQ